MVAAPSRELEMQGSSGNYDAGNPGVVNFLACVFSLQVCSRASVVHKHMRSFLVFFPSEKSSFLKRLKSKRL